MKPFLLLIAMLSPFADDKTKPEKGDAEQITGTWKIVSRRFKGEDLKGEGPNSYKDLVSVFTTDLIKTQPEMPGSTYGYKLDPSAKPKRFEMWGEVEPGEARETHHGIYKIEGDTLTICWRLLKDGRRPTEFSAEKDDGNVIDVYRRVKPK